MFYLQFWGAFSLQSNKDMQNCMMLMELKSIPEFLYRRFWKEI